MPHWSLPTNRYWSIDECMLAVLSASEIYGTHKAIIDAATRARKKLHPYHRHLFTQVVKCADAKAFVRAYVRELDPPPDTQLKFQHS